MVHNQKVLLAFAVAEWDSMSPANRHSLALMADIDNDDIVALDLATKKFRCLSIAHQYSIACTVLLGPHLEFTGVS
ncbi:MAG TPA: hypothetical protein VMH83_15070 [Candidatus Acidoferrum sp.]|nr:hypothetical protein [Candidatus Acidoferrum sp.]